MNEEFEQLRGRFRNLADAEDGTPGASELAEGLSKLAEHLENGAASTDDERFAIAVHGLSSLADLLEPDIDGEVAPTPDQPDEEKPGLEQFIATFRSEAEKRIQGLSISLMGIFGESPSDEALEQSTDHLHAIRGGAAMLGLEDVAGLATEMENTLVTGRKVDEEHRDWPTKPLLRGYALLEEAIDADPLAIPDEKAENLDDVLADLLQYTKKMSKAPPTSPSDEEDVSRETSSTDDSPPEVEIAETGLGSEKSTLEQPILIVDDVDTIAASVGFILAELDVTIEIASHGEEALQRLQEEPFSLVISDVDMPRMDGVALTRMIRASDDLSHLPVILLTSLDHPEERQAGMEAGATDYLIKGAIGGGELMRRVQDLLEVAPVVERKKKPTKQRILVTEDTETVAASIAFVLSEGPFEIEIASNGKEGLRRLGQEHFDLLITDMQMPYMSGTELVQSVRDDESLEGLPVVMLTSVDDEELVNEAVDAGVDRYLKKGEVAGGKLLTIVEELLGKPSQG